MANTVAMGQMPRVLAAVDATHGLPYDAPARNGRGTTAIPSATIQMSMPQAWRPVSLGGMLTSSGPVSQFVARGATPASRIGRAALAAGGVEAILPRSIRTQTRPQV